MNEELYSIPITNSDAALMLVIVENGIRDMRLQLEKAAQKEKKLLVFFYKLTPGLQDHEKLCTKMLGMHQDLIRILQGKNGGYLKIDGGYATLLCAFLSLYKQSFEENVKKGEFKDRPELAQRMHQGFERRCRSSRSISPKVVSVSTADALCNSRVNVIDSGKLFAHDINRLFVGPQPQEDRLSKLIVTGPLSELDLGDQHRLDPDTASHSRGCDPQAPSPGFSLRQIHKGTCRMPELSAYRRAMLPGSSRRSPSRLGEIAALGDERSHRSVGARGTRYNEARAAEDLHAVPYGDEPRVQAQVIPLSAASAVGSIRPHQCRHPRQCRP
jgi:hypothetical protein